MLIELAMAGWLAFHAPGWLTLTGAGLLLGIWAATGLLQVPQHRALARRRSGEVIASLVRTNGIRTLLWMGRGVVAAMLLLRQPGVL